MLSLQPSAPVGHQVGVLALATLLELPFGRFSQTGRTIDNRNLALLEVGFSFDTRKRDGVLFGFPPLVSLELASSVCSREKSF
jgi:hypothetical protein